LPIEGGGRYLFCEDCVASWQAKLRNVFKTNDGQDVLMVLFHLSKILDTTYTGNADTHFNEGVRFLGTWLLKECAKADKKITIDVIGKYLT